MNFLAERQGTVVKRRLRLRPEPDGGGPDGGCRSRLSCTRSGRRVCSCRRTPSDIPRRRRHQGGRAGRTGTRRGRERSAGPAPIRPGPRPARRPGRPGPPIGCTRSHRRSGAPVPGSSGVGTSTRWRPMASRTALKLGTKTAPNRGRAASSVDSASVSTPARTHQRQRVLGREQMVLLPFGPSAPTDRVDQVDGGAASDQPDGRGPRARGRHENHANA